MTARRCIATLCFVALLPSCTHWVEYSPGPPAVGESSVRVTTTTGRQVELTGPFVDGPDYVGHQKQTVVRLPLDSITHFEVKEYHVGRTVLTVVATGAVVFVGLVAIAMSQHPYS